MRSDFIQTGTQPALGAIALYSFTDSPPCDHPKPHFWKFISRGD
jgi:hypothetical protein